MFVTPCQNITKKWMKIFQKHDKDLVEFEKILQIIKSDNFEPPLEKILNFAKFNFTNIKVVILGMDPYPTPGDAHGLSFSTLSEKCPKSLSNIYSVLIRENLLKEKPKSFDLSYLALQGFVLMNAALTVEKFKPGSHIKYWDNWMSNVIKSLSDEAPPIIWCLWGADAQKKKHLIDETKHTVLTHCHPVAMVNPSFLKCTHFRTIADKYPNIIWDPSQLETHFFTDGAAKGNQFKDKCRAAWGAVCTKGIYKDMSWNGLTLPTKVMFRNEEVEARPTNIRAEGEALIKVMKLACAIPAKVVIYSDSNFWITDMLGLYIPDWVANEIPFTHKKNSDLVTKFWNLAQNDKITFKFVNAWHDRQRPTNETDLYEWLGNKAAEEAAEAAL